MQVALKPQDGAESTHREEKGAPILEARQRKRREQGGYNGAARKLESECVPQKNWGVSMHFYPPPFLADRTLPLRGCWGSCLL